MGEIATDLYDLLLWKWPAEIIVTVTFYAAALKVFSLIGKRALVFIMDATRFFNGSTVGYRHFSQNPKAILGRKPENPKTLKRHRKNFLLLAIQDIATKAKGSGTSESI